MLKIATDAERTQAYNLVRSESVKIIELQSVDENALHNLKQLLILHRHLIRNLNRIQRNLTIV